MKKIRCRGCGKEIDPPDEFPDAEALGKQFMTLGAEVECMSCGVKTTVTFHKERGKPWEVQ